MTSVTPDNEVERIRVLLGLLEPVERDGARANDGWHRISASRSASSTLISSAALRKASSRLAKRLHAVTPTI
jgi:hypothetical protein